MIFDRVSYDEMDEVLHIYADSIGQEGCTWSEGYPSKADFDKDMERGDLYCLKNDEGIIVGVVSIDKDDLVEALDVWSTDVPSREISRLGVKREYQNQGIGRVLLESAMKVLKERGYKSAHFLVSNTNERALRSYSKIGCELKGECFLYEHEWLCYEKKLDTI